MGGWEGRCETVVQDLASGVSTRSYLEACRRVRPLQGRASFFLLVLTTEEVMVYMQEFLISSSSAEAGNAQGGRKGKSSRPDWR